MISQLFFIVAAVGLVAFTASGANDCSSKMEALKTYYEDDKKGCQETVTILDKEVECTDDDKAFLGDCLEVKKVEWDYVIEHCLGGDMEDSHENTEGSDAPMESPDSNTDDSSLDGRRLLSTVPVTCLEKLRDEGLDGFPEVPGYKRSIAFSSTISGVVMAATAIIAMML